MATVYSQGTILFIAQVLDKQGGNPKDRYVVLLQDLDSADTLLFGAAITGTFTKPLPATSIAMPVQKAGTRCKTGLTKPCITDCTWIVEATPGDIKVRQGFTPKIELVDILLQVIPYLAAVMAKHQQQQ